MQETIISFEHLERVKLTYKESVYENTFSGYRIITNPLDSDYLRVTKLSPNLCSIINKFLANTYEVLISSTQSCYEHWGYYLEINKQELSNDVANMFLEKEVLGIRWGRERERIDYGCRTHRTAVIDIKLKEYILSIVLFNNHNGYYSHSIIFAKNGKADVQSL